MSPFVAEHAGLIELTLVEGIVLAIAFRELWSVRRSLRDNRRSRPAEPAEAAAAPPPGPPDRAAGG